MTTSVTVKPANYPTKITVVSRDVDIWGVERIIRGRPMYLKAGEEYTYHCTLSNTLEIVDVEYEEVEGSRNEAAGFNP